MTTTTPKITLSFPQVPKGSASKYANTHAAKIYFGEHIIASSGRILKWWKSGNWASRSALVVKEFQQKEITLAAQLAEIGPKQFAAIYVCARRPYGRRVINQIKFNSFLSQI